MIEVKHTQKVYSSYKKHHHDTLSIATIQKGKIQISYDDHDSFLTPNTLAIFNPYENHKTTLISPDTEDYDIIYFDLESTLKIQQTETFTPITQSLISDPSLVKSFASLVVSKDDKEAEVFLENLFEKYCDMKEEQQVPSETLIKIRDYIESSDETLTLEALAKYANLSQNHLIRVFKKEFGLSPHAYILNHKVHKAKRLLEEGSTIAEASITAGFYDQSHFHKAFKSVFAITPKEFLKR